MSYNLAYPGLQIDSGISHAYEINFIIALSPPGQDITLGYNKCFFPMPFNCYITGADIDVRLPPTGNAIDVDIKKNGTSILGGNPMLIEANEFTSRTSSVPYSISTSGFSKYDYFSADINSAGSTFSGQDLVLSLYGIRR